MSSKANSGKFSGAQSVTAAALSIGQAEYTDRICDAIRAAAERHPWGAKFIARAANSNIRTVESWAAKRSTPGGLHLLRLMATVPEVQAEVRRLAGMESDIDPTFERDLTALFRTYSNLQNAKRE